jgi:hypothetical protein
MMQDAGRTTDLVGALVADLRPVRPVHLVREILVALALEVVVVLVTAWLIGARVSGTERLADPRFLALLVSLAAGATASAVAMTTLAIPGRSVPGRVRGLLVAFPVVVALTIAVLSPWGGTWKGFAAVLVEGFGCTRNTLVVAAPAWLAACLYLRRLAPLDPLRVGLFSASSALLIAAFAVQMACASCDSWHMAISHYAPVLLAAWAAALVSPLVLRQPASPRPPRR